jgi:D-beta-D-heptose 7-phosphate kinase/D-beta-D-heptose 1-phosphate adenosyltransferase
MLDRHLMGEAERLSPEAPVPVVRIAERRVTPGGAANVAANVTAGGGTCALVGVVAEDAPGAELRAAVAGARVRDLMLTVRDRPTTNKTRVLARNQQVVRIDEEREAEVSAEDRAQLAAAASDALAEAQVLVFQDYDKGVCSAPLIKLLIAAAKQRGIPIVVDPKFRTSLTTPGRRSSSPTGASCWRRWVPVLICGGKRRWRRSGGGSEPRNC